jgi:hypothetical protein
LNLDATDPLQQVAIDPESNRLLFLSQQGRLFIYALSNHDMNQTCDFGQEIQLKSQAIKLSH